MTKPHPQPRRALLAAAALGGLVALVSSPGRVQAHAIESSLDRLQELREELVLESHFSNGEPVQGAVVRLVPPDGGAAVEVGQIDARGRLGFTMPKGVDGRWELQVDAGPGHRDFLEVPTSQGRAQLDQVSTVSPQIQMLAAPFQRFTPTLLIGGLTGLGGILGGMMLLRRRS
jgi:nickel transport protein